MIFLHGKAKLFTPGPTFSVRGQIVNILGFAGHTASVSTTQFCWCSKWVWLCSDKTTYHNRQQARFGPQAIVSRPLRLPLSIKMDMLKLFLRCLQLNIPPTPCPTPRSRLRKRPGGRGMKNDTHTAPSPVVRPGGINRRDPGSPPLAQCLAHTGTSFSE